MRTSRWRFASRGHVRVPFPRFEQGVAQSLDKLVQDLGTALFGDQVPDQQAFVRREGLEQARDCVRRHRRQPGAQFGRVLLVHKPLDEVVPGTIPRLPVHQGFHPPLAGDQRFDGAEVSDFRIAVDVARFPG